MMDRTGAKFRPWLLLVILLLAFGLRIYRLGAESLWYDETVSVYLAGRSLAALVAHTAGDIHPPGYYLLLHGWIRLAGKSEFAAAFLSLFFGLLLVALAHRLAVRLFGWRAGLLAALLVAVSPYNLWYSQEVRMYTVGAVLGLGLLAAMISLLVTRPGTAHFRFCLALYVLCGALGLWVLYYFAFLLAAVNLMVATWWLFGWRRRRVGWRWLGRWTLAQGAVLLLYALWIPVAWRQATNPPVPPWRGFTGLGELWLETWSALSLGQSVQPQKVWPVLILVAVVFGLGLFFETSKVSKTSKVRRLRWFLAGYVFMPVFLIYLASFFTPLYHVRYAFTYSTPFYILLGAGLTVLWRRWRLGMWLSLAVLIAFSGASIYTYHTDPHYTDDDHRAAVHFVAEHWRPGDAILVNAGYVYTAVVTYWDGDPIAWRGRLVSDSASDFGWAAHQGPVVVQTGTVDGDPSLGWGDPDSDFYAMSQAETAGALTRLFADFDRVWVYRCYDTVTDPDGFIRRWLDQHGTQFEDRVFTGESQLRVQGFLTARDPLAGADRPFDVALADDSLRLLASTAWEPEAAVGGALDLALVWRVGSPPGDDPILFLGLFDETGRRWGQTDERPLGSLYPPAAWPQGVAVRTPLRLRVPPGTPPGRYRLEIGWYRFVEGQPLWLPWTTGERLALGEVDVVAPGDWWALPTPSVAHPVGVTLGPGVQVLGFDAPVLEGQPGDVLPVDLLWRAVEDEPEPGLAVLRLVDDSGTVLVEAPSAPAGGRAPFVGLRAGQMVRDPRSLMLPGGLAPGVYTLSLGRLRPDGTWLPVRRGPFPLGSTYPLATVRVMQSRASFVGGRPLNLTPPPVQHLVDARFGDSIRLVGYDFAAPRPKRVGQSLASNLQLILYWQALQPMVVRYKVFVHLVGEDGPSDIRAQTDVYPHLPTTGWVPGEYLSEAVVLALPADLPPGSYALLVGLYDETTGNRLPVLDAAGAAMGDSLRLQEVHLGQ